MFKKTLAILLVLTSTSLMVFGFYSRQSAGGTKGFYLWAVENWLLLAVLGVFAAGASIWIFRYSGISQRYHRKLTSDRAFRELKHLCALGVSILNEGTITVRRTHEIDRWWSSAEKWCENVKLVMSHLNSADASNWRTLGAFKLKDFHTNNIELNYKLTMIEERLDWLKVYVVNGQTKEAEHDYPHCTPEILTSQRKPPMYSQEPDLEKTPLLFSPEEEKSHYKEATKI